MFAVHADSGPVSAQILTQLGADYRRSDIFSTYSFNKVGQPFTADCLTKTKQQSGKKAKNKQSKQTTTKRTQKHETKLTKSSDHVAVVLLVYLLIEILSYPRSQVLEFPKVVAPCVNCTIKPRIQSPRVPNCCCPLWTVG